ncbi:sodium/mannose cotransporter SLC5A10-like [Ornithodoros turicata]|uniref:sodium/mannose cotransporter SLC5A10-like n=1 Tax=Ornithodoros turicata TaxID=34597 RepID=UPI003138D291
MEGKHLLSTTLDAPDIAVVAAYFVSVLAVGIWSSMKSKRDTMSGYFLAGRGMNFVLVGTSLFASNMGTDHFVGLSGSGAAGGITISVFELNALFVVLILAWVFVPVYLASGVFTMPEYLRKRFGGQRIRIYLAVLALLLYIFTKISADLYAGALFIRESLNWNLYASIAVLLAITVISTVGGGLTAVLWIDFVQALITVLGASVLAALAFIEVGGYDALIRKFANATAPTEEAGHDSMNQTCGTIPERYMHLFRSAGDSEMPWPGMTLGVTINAIWYWCSDQVIVQRSLSSKDLSHAKAGSILTGYLKLLPLFVMVFPGMAARVLYPDIIGCSRPDKCQQYCGNEYGCTNIAYPLLVLKLMPVGGKGLMMAVMTASLVGNLASIFNSASTLFTVDIWDTVRKRRSSEMELLLVGRCFVAVLVAVSIMWIPVIEASSGSRLFDYIQSVTSYMAPPVCAVYLLAITWERINEPGAFWGLMVGLAMGMARFIWEYTYSLPPCASGLPDPRPDIITKVHYLHYGIMCFVVTATTATLVSLCTKPIPPDRLYRLTYWTIESTEPRRDLETNRRPSLCQDTGHANAACAKEDDDVHVNGEVPTVDILQIAETPEQVRQHRPKWKRALFWICGAEIEKENVSPPDLTPAEEALEAVRAIQEKPVLRRLCAINGLVLLGVACFVFGYYA